MLTKLKILIVEDEALIAENLKLTLEDLGYQVSGTYYHFEEARQAIQDTEADLVLLDINLGSTQADQTGLTLAALLQQTHPVPFIFLTAYQDKETILAASQLRPSAYLIKPVNPASVFAAIQMALAHQPSGALIQPPPQPDYFYIKLGNQTHRLLWQDVYCLEASKNYVLLRMLTRGLTYPIRGTLRFVLDNLVPSSLRDCFVRINRSIVLHKAYIESYTVDTIVCQSTSYENTRFTMGQLKALLP